MNGTPERSLETGALRALADDLWVIDHPLRVFGLALGSRMTVIRLADRSLFLHSPVPLDDEVRAGLDAVGTVRHAVAPNKVHHFFVAAVRDAYRDCALYAAPGLAEKRSDVRFDAELCDDPPDAWRGQIDQRVVRGIEVMNEVAFFHRASRSLLLTDLAFNVQHSDSLWTRLWCRAGGIYRHFGPSRMVRMLVRDREAARASIDAILRWDFDRVIVPHGIVLQRSGKRMLRAAYQWL